MIWSGGKDCLKLICLFSILIGLSLTHRHFLLLIFLSFLVMTISLNCQETRVLEGCTMKVPWVKENIFLFDWKFVYQYVCLNVANAVIKPNQKESLRWRQKWKRNSGSLCFPFLYSKVVKEVTGRNEFTGRCLLSAVEARGQGGVHEGLLGWQEEVASCLLAPSSCRHPCALKHVSLSTGFSSCSFSFPTDLGEEDKRQHQDEDLFGPASAWALCDPPEVSGLMFSSILLPSTPFLEWFLVLSCFLNRKFLTWEWLLGLGRRRTLWWIPQGTLVASPVPPCIVLSLRQLLLVVRHPETVVRSGALGVGFTDFFFFWLMLCLLFFLF